MPGTIDRRVAAALLALSAAVVLPLAGLTEAPLPSRGIALTAAAANDPGAAADLARLMELGSRGTWLVVYSAVRTSSGVSGGSRRVVVASLPPSRLVSDGETLMATIGEESFACGSAAGRLSCSEGVPTRGTGMSPDRIIELISGSDRYAVSHDDRRRIAGEMAECFRLVAGAGVTARAAFAKAEYCYAADGVLLDALAERADTLDTLVATRVKRDIGAQDLLRILKPFGALPPG